MGAMGIRETLLEELEEAPEPVLEELLQFLHLLQNRETGPRAALPLLSESSLARDWLRPEEDEAWAHL